MHELSLFTGAGGGLLATKYLLGFKAIGYVEINTYCQAVLAQRIKDGFLDPAPIFGDIRKFISEGYAKTYQGMVDVITGGDPCQGNSGAYTHGKIQESLAFEFIETIRIVRPTYVVRENPAKLRKDALSPDWKFKEWIESLGYTATIAEVRACCMGADHQRSRMFVLGQLSDTLCTGLVGDELQEAPRKKDGLGKIGRQNRWTATPRIHRKTDGVACIVDRLRAIGNGQVPRVVEAACTVLF